MRLVGGGGGGGETMLSGSGPVQNAFVGSIALGSLVPRPRFPTAADGLHHRYVERGSGEMPNKSRSTCA